MISPSKIHVLVVDDEAELREMIAARFRVFGFDTHTAYSGNQASNKLLEVPDMHILITDVRMADGSGIELLQNVKQKNADSPRVFVISAYSDYSLEELLDMGADGFLGKPFDTKLMVQTIRKALLSRTDQWKMPPNKSPEHSLKMKFNDLSTAIKDKDLLLGRGGFSIATNEALPGEGQMISFDITLDDFSLKGAGVVRWKSSKGAKDQKSYVGLEIAYLEPESLATVTKWIDQNKPVSFIPSSRPQKIAS